MSNGNGRTVRLAKEGVAHSRNSGPRRIKRVFIDVDTQRDSMYPHGADYFPQAGRIAPRVARLFRCAKSQGYPVISTTMCLRNDVSARPRPGNGCVEGTNGQKKPAFALLAKRVSFGTNGGTDLPLKILSRCQQLIFEKRGANPFEHPKLDRLLNQVRASEYVVFGLATEEAVKHTVLGLLARGKQVRLVIDATAGRDRHETEMALRQMLAKGARIITARELAPTMQPRLASKKTGKRLVITPQTPTSKIATRLIVAALSAGGNGDGNGNGNGNGKKSKVHGDNGNGNGNGKKAKAHGGNGNGNGNGNGKKAKTNGGNGHNGKASSKRAAAPEVGVAASIN